jgi:homoserine kinase
MSASVVLVQKFGGEALDRAARVKRAAAIVEASSRPTVVVVALPPAVSAALREACGAFGDRERTRGEERMTFAEGRFRELAITTLDGWMAWSPAVDAAFGHIRKTLESAALFGEMTGRATDRVLAEGERLMARLFVAALAEARIAAELFDATAFIEASGPHGDASPSLNVAAEPIRQALGNRPDPNVIAVVPGGCGRGDSGLPVTFGRSGSDLTATVLAAALGAGSVTIWTDVDGVFAADPAHHPDAKRIDQLNFREMAELSFYGADVLHPRTLIPVIPYRIPVYVRGIDASPSVGTVIDERVTPGPTPVKGVSAIRGHAVVSIEGKGMAGVPGVAARTFRALADAGVSVTTISQASSESSITVSIADVDTARADRALREAFRLDLSHGDIEEIVTRRSVALVAAVGVGMASTPGISGRLFGALGDAGVNVLGIAQGSSELNVTFAVDEGDLGAAVESVLAAFDAGGSPERARARVSDNGVRVFAPGTVANLGPAFDVLGLAIDGTGDTVVARLSDTPGIQIAAITGDNGALSRDAKKNTAGIAAQATLDRAGASGVGISIELHKGMPIGSGLGSSAASAAAAAFAVNLLLGSPLRRTELILPCVEGEAAVSGRHADNVAPALMGGVVLVRSVDPLDVVRLPAPQATLVVVTPAFELSTRVAREALPKQISIAQMVAVSANVAMLVAACYSGDLSLLSRCIDDPVVTPARIGLIPGGADVIAAAKRAGALGASISGAGPSIFALCHSTTRAQIVADAMVAAFEKAGLASKALISSTDCPGARRV